MINHFNAIFRWNEATEQWRMLAVNGDGILKARQEFLDCVFIEAKFKGELSKIRDNYVRITLEMEPLEGGPCGRSAAGE